MSSTAGPDDKTTRHTTQEVGMAVPLTSFRHDDPFR